MSINRRMDKLWFIHIVEYYLATKRNKLLIYAAKWMNLRNTVLSKRSHAKEYTRYDSIYIKF